MVEGVEEVNERELDTVQPASSCLIYKTMGLRADPFWDRSNVGVMEGMQYLIEHSW